MFNFYRNEETYAFITPACVCSVTQSCPTLCDPMDWSSPTSSVHRIFQARYWSELPLLQGIFLTQGSNSHLLRLQHWRVSSLPLSHRGGPLSSLIHCYNLVIEKSKTELTKEVKWCDIYQGVVTLNHHLNHLMFLNSDSCVLTPDILNSPSWRTVQGVCLFWHKFSFFKWDSNFQSESRKSIRNLKLSFQLCMRVCVCVSIEREM